MQTLTPWGAGELSRLKDDIDRLFESLFEDFGLCRAERDRDLVLEKTAEGWRLTYPLPGYEPEEVVVGLTGRVLSLTAVSKASRPGERTVRGLSRKWTLPFEACFASADVKEGRLKVELVHRDRSGAACG